MEWSTCNPQKHNETQERLVRIEAKLDKLLNQEEASSTNAKILDLHTKLERIENLLAGLQENVSTSVSNASISALFTRIGSRLIYIEKEIEKSWDAAEETCREMGGHLATIQNESDFTAIKDELSHPESYWLGISDVAKEGEYVSVATGKLAPFLNTSKSDSTAAGLIARPLLHCIRLEEVMVVSRSTERGLRQMRCGYSSSGSAGYESHPYTYD
uniref:Accessory gland protein Acp29AB-like n=1 Tax=Drosophila rhopaloa TaxID=1041015 RepID=A0A6P4FGG7_DRORH